MLRAQYCASKEACKKFNRMYRHKKSAQQRKQEARFWEIKLLEDQRRSFLVNARFRFYYQ